MTEKLKSVVEQPSVTRAVALQRGGAVDGSETAYEFDAPVQLELFVTATTREDREQLVTGTDETVSYKLAAMRQRNVTEGDRLWFDDGRSVRATIQGVPSGLNPYRVGVPQTATMDGETFAWFPLTEDQRGDATGSDSTDESGSGSGSSGDSGDVWLG